MIPTRRETSVNTTHHQDLSKKESKKNPLGRKVTIESNQTKTTTRQTNYDTLKKVIAVALIVLVVVGVFIPPSMFFQPPMNHTNSCEQGECSTSIPALVPYTSTPTYVHGNGHPIQSFPLNLYRVIHPGLMTVKDGTSCVISSALSSPKECEELSDLLVKVLEKYQPSDYYAIKASKSEKGVPVTDPYTSITVNIGMDARKVINHQQALKYLEKNVLTNPDFFHNDKSKILNAIMETHRLTVNHLSSTAGNFRTQMVIVRDDKTAWTEEGLLGALVRNGGTNEHKKHLMNLYKKITHSFPAEKAFQEATEAEMEALKMVCFVPCAVEEVEAHMDIFVSEIKELAQKILNCEIDTIAAAAYIHQQLGIIHPFEDANGRVARAWMNVILQLGGYDAIAIPNEEEYTQAVIEDQKNPGTFVSYLEKLIKLGRVIN